jgi:hypothetical protein
MADAGGHQLPMANFPHLSGREMLAGGRFYDEYYFRPKVVARIVARRFSRRKSGNGSSKEAREYQSSRQATSDGAAWAALAKTAASSQARCRPLIINGDDFGYSEASIAPLSAPIARAC